MVRGCVSAVAPSLNIPGRLGEAGAAAAAGDGPEVAVAEDEPSTAVAVQGSHIHTAAHHIL